MIKIIISLLQTPKPKKQNCSLPVTTTTLKFEEVKDVKTLPNDVINTDVTNQPKVGMESGPIALSIGAGVLLAAIAGLLLWKKFKGKKSVFNL